jgi:hypothetical protein
MGRRRAVTVKLRQGRQTIGTWTTTLDPDDDDAVRALLINLCVQRGIDDPGPQHSVEISERGRWLREVTAA